MDAENMEEEGRKKTPNHLSHGKAARPRDATFE
jgi:hypothetical protein